MQNVTAWAAWEQHGTSWAEAIFPPGLAFPCLGHSSPPALSAAGDTSSSVCCCQQHGWLPFWFCLEKACLFCRGLLEKHQNINPLIYLPISSPANLGVMPELDTVPSFLYDVRPRQVRLCSVHKYTNASSVCWWKSEKSWVRMSHGYSTDLHSRERNFRET